MTNDRARALDAGYLYLVPLLGAIGILMALGWPVLGGRAFLRDDLAAFHLPVRELYAQALARGQNLLWFPQILAGYYMHGEGQVGLLHPLHLVLYRALPLIVALNIELLLNYVALLGGTYLFLRRYLLPRTAALFGALVFAFSGFNLMHFVHPNMVGVIAHMPWLLVAIDIAMRDEDRARVAAAQLAIGVVTASQVLQGHPQAMWLSSFMELLYMIFLIPQQRTRGRLWAVALAKVLGVAGGAVQLLPTWEAVFDSARGAVPEAFPYAHPLDPANLLQLFSPYLARARVFGSPFPQEAVVYCGAFASIVPVWLLLRGRRAEFRRLANGALALAAIAVLLSLGERAYLYRILAHLPLIDRFQAAGRYIVLLHFAMAVGAAVAVSDLAGIVERRRPLAWKRTSVLALVPAASLLLALGAAWMRARPQSFPALAGELASSGPVLAGTGLVCLAALLTSAAARGMRLALPILMLAAAADQAYYGLSFLREYPAASPSEFAAAQALPPTLSGYRVQSINDMLTMSGVRLADGYISFPPVQLLDRLDGQRLRIAGVKWVQLKTPWESVEPLHSSLPNWEGRVRGKVVTRDALGGTSVWAEVIDPMPRTWLVSHETVSSDPPRDIGAIDPLSAALVQEDHALEVGPPGTVKVVSDEPGLIRLAATSPSRQLLILPETWHRGWEVRVDGASQTVVRVFGDFMGCVVGAGSSEVEFRFRPRSFRVGLWISICSLALMFVRFGVTRGTKIRRSTHIPAHPDT